MTSQIRQRVYYQKLTRANSDAPAYVLIRSNPSSFNREQYLPFSGVLGPTFPIAGETFRAARAPKGVGLWWMSITVTSDREDKMARPLVTCRKKLSIDSVISFIYNVYAPTADFNTAVALEKYVSIYEIKRLRLGLECALCFLFSIFLRLKA